MREERQKVQAEHDNIPGAKRSDFHDKLVNLVDDQTPAKGRVYDIYPRGRRQGSDTAIVEAKPLTTSTTSTISTLPNGFSKLRRH